VSWRTFICGVLPIRQRFNGSGHYRRAGVGYRKLLLLQYSRAKRLMNIADQPYFHCAPARFDKTNADTHADQPDVRPCRKALSSNRFFQSGRLATFFGNG
jgi:hypothetical protein